MHGYLAADYHLFVLSIRQRFFAWFYFVNVYSDVLFRSEEDLVLVEQIHGMTRDNHEFW
jgi:hypothetical protein